MDSRSNEVPKHTPGRWFADHWDGDKSKDIAIQSDWLDGVTLIGEIDSDKMADARLIVAAPEMLEALKSIVDTVWFDRLDTDLILTVEHVIAKAEGRQG